jgi:hypothetical protein
MARKKFHKIISVMMAMLVLLSSTGFSMDLHFCQGQLKSFSLFGKAETCHAQAAKSHCQKKKKTCHASISNQDEVGKCKKNCCSNKTVKIESNNDIKNIQTLELAPLQAKFLTAFIQVYLLKKSEQNKAIIPHLNYVPPLLNKDIPVLIQSFLL